METELTQTKPAVVWVWRLRGGAKHQYALMPPGRYSPDNQAAYGEVIKQGHGWDVVCSDCHEDLPARVTRKQAVQELISHRNQHGERLWLWWWARYAKPPRN